MSYSNTTGFFGFASYSGWCAWRAESGFEIMDLTPDVSYLRQYMSLQLELRGGWMSSPRFALYYKKLPENNDYANSKNHVFFRDHAKSIRALSLTDKTEVEP